MNEKWAMTLTKPADLLRACISAEESNCEQGIIRELRRRYYAAVEKECEKWLVAQRKKAAK